MGLFLVSQVLKTSTVGLKFTSHLVSPFKHSSRSHALPSPLYPFRQVQVKLPLVFLQVAFKSQSWLPLIHSLISSQILPSPTYPLLHAQLKLPGIFAQVALLSQSFWPFMHSFTSVQLKPLPRKPELHSQSNPSSVLEHVPCAWHVCVPREHWSASIVVVVRVELRVPWSIFRAHISQLFKNVKFYGKGQKTLQNDRQIVWDNN